MAQPDSYDMRTLEKIPRPGLIALNIGNIFTFQSLTCAISDVIFFVEL